MGARRGDPWKHGRPRPRRGAGRIEDGPDAPPDPAVPSPRHPAPVAASGGWFVLEPLGSRLWQKSGLGRPAAGGGVVLDAAEVLFCHWHRHLQLPSDDWLATTMETDGDLLARARVIEHVRRPGDLLSLCTAHPEFEVAEGTWAVRWSRADHPSRDEPPAAQVRWTTAAAPVDWPALAAWAAAVLASSMVAEVHVVDADGDVTRYVVEIVVPNGRHEPPPDAPADAVVAAWATRRDRGEGTWVPWPAEETWPLPGLGVQTSGGRWLDAVAARWLARHVGGDQPEADAHERMLDDLLRRGLLPRSGFKYGTRWRAYEGPIESGHAEWLLAPLDEAPSTWQGACLAARLANGVRKRWACWSPASGTHVSVVRQAGT